jgi:hypothetical protein
MVIREDSFSTFGRKNLKDGRIRSKRPQHLMKMIRSNRIVAVLEPKRPCTSSELNSLYHERIDELLKDPYINIIMSENFIFAAKYLESRRFRNCTIYHIGDEPKHIIGKFKTKGGFTSTIELEECLRQDSTEVIL